MSNQPTGEWTVERIINAMLEEQKANPAWNEAELWGIERDIVPLLRTRINAALDAVKSDESEYYRKCYVQCSKDFQKLRSQLSEHEKAILTLTENCKHWRTQLTDYKQQAESMLATSMRVNDQLRSQVQTLMDAIHDHNEIAYCDSRGMLQTALAKVKEGK